MFLKVVTLLFIITFGIEYYPLRTLFAARSRATRSLYYTLSALCVIPYLALLLAAKWIENESAALSAFSATALILFLTNFLWKFPLALVLLCGPKCQRWARKVAFSLSLIATLLMAYGALWERHSLRTTHLTLHYDNLPEGADGLKIVQISDLHIGYSRASHRLLERVRAEVMSHKAHLVVDCGDMVNAKYTELDSAAMATLGRITAPLGVYTVLGNHDRGDYIADTLTLPRQEHRTLLIERQQQMGWHNLTDSTAILPVGGDTLYLTAIDYPASTKKGSHGAAVTEDYTHHFDSLPTEGFNIVLAHTPTMWESILAATQAELTLSGHVHAMQLRLPLGPRGWSPAAIVYKHWSGLYQKDGCRLFVSDGIGGGVPFRIGARPQIVVITLKKNV